MLPETQAVAAAVGFRRRLWLCEGYAVSHEKERLLPDGTVELVINLKRRPDPGLRTAQSRKLPYHSGLRGFGPAIGVLCDRHRGRVGDGRGFTSSPAARFRFFRCPSSELNNQSVALESLWGAGSARLRERLLEAATPEEKFRVLECCLLEQLAKPLEHHPAVAFALQQFFGRMQPPPVSRVVEQVGFSQRRFIQLFSNEVGLTPKLFSRVSRFQQVIQTAHAVGEIDWVQVALECGYYDQAHFIHDFQSFAGITPSAVPGAQDRRM